MKTKSQEPPLEEGHKISLYMTQSTLHHELVVTTAGKSENIKIFRFGKRNDRFNTSRTNGKGAGSRRRRSYWSTIDGKRNFSDIPVRKKEQSLQQWQNPRNLLPLKFKVIVQ
ncbi:hypothetical protein SLEP1_g22357 [Rubroshorea leprosula]|uniref:Ribosomal protein L2 n=1 Tax=Rubroshorea leprosula TaxID=152421 RepID=A0AAV5JHS0_9ROSI|nr:hypothetical protein SLEP1_g22357 [Rubroshorea leprosula]